MHEYGILFLKKVGTKLVIRYSKKNIISWIAISFIAMIAIGAIFQINTYVVLAYILIVMPLLLSKYKLILENIKTNVLVKIWLLYILIGFMTTFYHGQLFKTNAIFVDLSFALIALALAASTDRIFFYRNFVRFMYILSIVVLVTQIIHVDVFGMLKAGSAYSSIDISSGGGVSAIFEYRHYYGIMLAGAFFMNLYYGKESRKFLTACLFILNIIISYTRSAWIAFAFGLAIYLWKEKKSKIKSKILLYVIMILWSIFLIGLLLPELWLPIAKNIVDRFVNAKITTSTYLYGGVRGYVVTCGVQYILNNWKKYLFFGGGSGFALMWLRENPYGLYKEWTAAIDVQYITVLMDRGIIGLALILGLVISQIRVCVSQKNNKDYLTALIVLVMCVSFCFFDVFDTCTSVFAFWMFILCLQGNGDIEAKYGKEMKI